MNEFRCFQGNQVTPEAQDSGSGYSSEDRSTDWPTIVARYGSANYDEQDVAFPQPMDLNGGLFESLAESQNLQYFAQADYDNGNGPMGATNDDDLIEEDHGLAIVACAAEIQSPPSQNVGGSDEVQEIPRPVENYSASKKNSTNHNFKTYPPKQTKHRPECVPFAEQYDIFGNFVCSELMQMRSIELRKHLKTIIQRVITDTSREDDMEYSLSTNGNCNGGLQERTCFDESSIESDEDQAPFGKLVAMRLQEIRSDERRRRLKRTIQRFMLDIGEEDDMEYTVADQDSQIKQEPEENSA